MGHQVRARSLRWAWGTPSGVGRISAADTGPAPHRVCCCCCCVPAGEHSGLVPTRMKLLLTGAACDVSSRTGVLPQVQQGRRGASTSWLCRCWAQRLARPPSSSSLGTTAATTPSASTPQVRCALADGTLAGAPQCLAVLRHGQPQQRACCAHRGPRWALQAGCRHGLIRHACAAAHRPRRDLGAEPQLCGGPCPAGQGRGGHPHQPQ